MHSHPKVSPEVCRYVFTAASALLACLALASGCKTSSDATAAATQLTSTAKALTDYYCALDTMLGETDELYTIQGALVAAAPYDAAAKSLVANTRAEIKKREALARDLTTLARSFSRLSGSTAPDDVATSAASLETEVASLKPIGTTLDSEEQNVMKIAIESLVKAVKEHKEREAAKAINSFTGALTTFFTREEPDCNSIGATYAAVSKSMALYLVEHGQADPSDLLKVVLAPYGLTAHLTDAGFEARILTIAKQQINQKADALEAAQKSASNSMEKSLKEMATRIQVVADDKPMSARIPPITLANVEKWSADVLGASAGSADTAAPATPESPR